MLPELESTLRNLAVSALFFLEMRQEGSFLSNAAAERLLQEGQDAIPSIEWVIHEYVQDESSKRSAGSLSSIFPGIEHLVYTYILLGSKELSQQVAVFIEGQEDEFRIIALRTILCVFNRKDRRHDTTEYIPSEYLQLAQRRVSSLDETGRNMATMILTKMVIL